MFLKKAFMLLQLAALIPSALFADEAIPHFKNVGEGSELTFQVMWNDEPLAGEFKTFEIDIAFDPKKLEQSKVDVAVYTSSVSVADGDAQNTLPQDEWLDSDVFPQAHFKANQFKQLDENHYQAEGVLTLKGHALPITFNFTLEIFSPSEAFITGNATLQRKAFSVGWESTEAVENDVIIQVKLKAKN